MVLTKHEVLAMHSVTFSNNMTNSTSEMRVNRLLHNGSNLTIIDLATLPNPLKWKGLLIAYINGSLKSSQVDGL